MTIHILLVLALMTTVSSVVRAFPLNSQNGLEFSYREHPISFLNTDSDSPLTVVALTSYNGANRSATRVLPLSDTEPLHFYIYVNTERTVTFKDAYLHFKVLTNGHHHHHHRPNLKFLLDFPVASQLCPTTCRGCRTHKCEPSTLGPATLGVAYQPADLAPLMDLEDFKAGKSIPLMVTLTSNTFVEDEEEITLASAIITAVKKEEKEEEEKEEEKEDEDEEENKRENPFDDLED